MASFIPFRIDEFDRSHGQFLKIETRNDSNLNRACTIALQKIIKIRLVYLFSFFDLLPGHMHMWKEIKINRGENSPKAFFLRFQQPNGIGINLIRFAFLKIIYHEDCHQ